MGGVTYYDDDDTDIWLYYTYDEPSHVTRARWEAEAKGLKFVAEAVPIAPDAPPKKKGWPKGKPRRKPTE